MKKKEVIFISSLSHSSTNRTGTDLGDLLDVDEVLGVVGVGRDDLGAARDLVLKRKRERESGVERKEKKRGE